MRTIPTRLTAVALAAAALNANAQLDTAQIEADLWAAATWQMGDQSRFLERNWEIGPLYDGLLNAAIATGEPAYMGEVIYFGERNNWALNTGSDAARRNADNHCVGHAWLDIYMTNTDRTDRLQPTKDVIDYNRDNPASDNTEFYSASRFTWCDTLYMGPPTWTKLYLITGETSYLDRLEEEWRFAYSGIPESDFPGVNGMWSDLPSPVTGEPDHLFFRDLSQYDWTANNGERHFWSRGNGWVFAGLALTIPEVPESHPSHTFYLDVFRKMAAKLITLQQPSGLWHTNLLDPDDSSIFGEDGPGGEASGTGFFTFGLARGVRMGWLDEATYWPYVEAGWEGLETVQEENGKIGYVQGVGAYAVTPDPNNHHTYGTGAWLLAGSEILRHLLPGTDTPLADSLDQAEAYAAYLDQALIGPTLDEYTIVDSTGNQDGYPPANIFDGRTDPESRWSNQSFGTPTFVEIDLGENRELLGAEVHAYQNRDYQYIIEGRPSTGTWRTLVDRTDNTEPTPVQDIVEGSPASVRYLRITVTGAATYDGSWVSLKELRLAFRDNIADFTTPAPPFPTLRTVVQGCNRADLSLNGDTDQLDLTMYLSAAIDGLPLADWNSDGTIDTFDTIAFLRDKDSGCE